MVEKTMHDCMMIPEGFVTWSYNFANLVADYSEPLPVILRISRWKRVCCWQSENIYSDV